MGGADRRRGGRVVSYDVSFMVTEPHAVASENYTYNVYRHLRFMFDNVEGVKSLAGMRAGDALPLLLAAIERGQASENVSKLDAQNPANGWGSRAGCVSWLERLAKHAAEHPDSVVEVS